METTTSWEKLTLGTSLKDKLNQELSATDLVDALSCGIIIINEVNAILYINHWMVEHFGHSLNDVEGETLNIYLPDDAVQAIISHRDEHFSTPDFIQSGSGDDVYAMTKAKQKIPVELSLRSIKTQERLSVIIVNDISARKKVETDLLERNRELDDFSHIVAHDLNSSITRISGFSELLLMENASSLPEASKQEFLEDIVNSSNKMGRVIRELLLYANTKKGQVLSYSLEMKQVLDEAISRISHTIEQCDVTIDIKEPLHPSVGYGPWIEEVWLKFLINSIKYGGNPPRICISSRKVGDYIEYSIEDNGNGLSQEDFELILSNRKEERLRIIKGDGFGLKIIYRILAKLDGKLKLKTSEMGGCQFLFLLPAVNEPTEIIK